MAASPPRTVTLKIGTPLERTDMSELLERTCALLERDVDVLCCEVAGVAADALAVDALARVALVARRYGCAVRLCGASTELRRLVAFAGLEHVLYSDAGPQRMPTSS